MRPIIICDVDNVLNDDRWRRPFINMEHPDLMARFHTYHSMSMHDWSFNSHLLRENCEVWLFTCMPERYRKLRMAWLREHGMPYYGMLMRRDGDERESPLVKSDMLTALLARSSRDDIEICYDDRADVCEMYRARGFIAKQVAIDPEDYLKKLTQETPVWSSTPRPPLA